MNRVGIVSYTLRDDTVTGWPGSESELLQLVADAGCDMCVTSLLPRGSAVKAGPIELPSSLRCALIGRHSETHDRTVVVCTPEASRSIYEHSVPGKPGNQVEASVPFSQHTLPERVVDRSAFVLIERELNILTYDRRGARCRELIGLTDFLSDQTIPLVLHASSKNLRRWETNPKRAWLSGGGRIVIGVWNWNATGHAEPMTPWRVFQDGFPGNVTEIDAPRYARVGICDVDSVIAGVGRYAQPAKVGVPGKDLVNEST